MEEVLHQRSVNYSDLRGDAICTYKVNDKNELASDLQIGYLPKIPSRSSRPGAIKVPLNFVKQLQGMPREIQGCPLDIIIACSHYANDPERNKSNLIVGGITNEV